MHRKSSPTVTPEMADQIRLLKAQGLYHHQIAALLEINQGRVSEVVTGKLHPPAGPRQNSLDI
ncbi:hypothetical protein IFT67_17745 [Sphingomonas sp. CFBP 13728]|uniref:hypothetical protein n=1 Tax=Sphingomonas sp. CFBP 13728 TaxID=2775294 RepID=UPI001781526B|nr:hypothetical protein [Sphingomonas sp. CFBP 13728]MBD8620766.1 hypothetical protein [Sphingomonas sp. CFBP 13728]